MSSVRLPAGMTDGWHEVLGRCQQVHYLLRDHRHRYCKIGFSTLLQSGGVALWQPGDRGSVTWALYLETQELEEEDDEC